MSTCLLCAKRHKPAKYSTEIAKMDVEPQMHFSFILCRRLQSFQNVIACCNSHNSSGIGFALAVSNLPYISPEKMAGIQMPALYIPLRFIFIFNKVLAKMKRNFQGYDCLFSSKNSSLV